MIDRATVDKIMDAVNIVDVVGEFVNLRKAGVNYKGLCPFHDDKTPSFMVSPARQICKCFACGEGGNAVNFLMKHEQITYPEALRWLAKKYNIEIQERELSDDDGSQLSWDEIVGFSIIDAESGDSVGVVTAVDLTTINTLFELRADDGRPLLIPANDDLIDDIDRAGRTITMRLPGGLLDM